jgi:hypothetical protein
MASNSNVFGNNVDGEHTVMDDEDEESPFMVHDNQKFFSHATSFLHNPFRHQKTKRKMTPKDRFFLSPFQKWQKYRRFPFKIILHSLIILLTTVQIALVTVQYTGYSASSLLTIRHTFTPSFVTDSVTEADADGLYTVTDCLDAINYTVSQYYNFASLSLDRYVLLKENGIVRPVEVVVLEYPHDFYNDSARAWQLSKGNFEISKERFNLTIEDPLGPLADMTQEEAQRYLFRVSEIRMNMYFENLDYGGLGPVLFLWEVTVTMDFSSGAGRIGFSVNAYKQIIDYQFSTLWSTIVIDIVIGLLALASLLLSLR